MLRFTRAAFRYHQEIFLARQEFFLSQVMRGLKVEKRWEPGMGYGIFAREAVGKGDLIMFDLPFLSLDINSCPEVLKDLLIAFEIDKKVSEVLRRTVESVCFESKKDESDVKEYFLRKEVDIDLTWMTVIASYGKTYCNNISPVASIPFNYFSYIDDYYKKDTLGQHILELGYEIILDVTGIDHTQFTLEQFWISLLKVKSNVHNDALYPVAPTLINHSCWPNAVFESDGALVATEDIPADTQVTVSLYGPDCKTVEEKGLAGEKFKCFTPGCQFSKRVPLPEPKEEKPKKELIYRTPWHKMECDGPIYLAEARREDLWDSPAKRKYKQMYRDELSRAGIDKMGTPELPGSRPKRLFIRDSPGEQGQLLKILPPTGRAGDIFSSPTGQPPSGLL
eukprot:TRINITY_DN14539_c0_g1_i1.p1 TRINITY_DN14539_c0_g1~~TRINITY_DN14539_c0_g1_i1.p1  ORF type:complete len:408 (+),score=71.21 TRINITY_DN14539_c0_g1_i1:45-1226(+)